MKDAALAASSVAPRIMIAFLLAAIVLGAIPSGGLSRSEAGSPEVANPDYHGALPWDIPEDGEPMIVRKIVDGDTLHLMYPHDDWYYPTRLIGIQAPELDGPYTTEACYGPEAREFLVGLLPVGTAVIAQKDITDEDRNGRRLRHIFIVEPGTDDAYLLSEVLVLGGFAAARGYPPDDLYDDVLADAEEIARGESDGLWGSCGS